MPKYDDFGRPIYETAEEYNNAHRTGKNLYTYGNQESDSYKRKAMIKTYRTQKTSRRYDNQTGKKKVKPWLIGVLIYVLAMIVFTVIQLVGDFSGSFEERRGVPSTWQTATRTATAEARATDGARRHSARQAPLTARERQPRRTAYKDNRVPGKAHACHPCKTAGQTAQGQHDASRMPCRS